MPSGSRAATIESRVRNSRQYAPSARGRAAASTWSNVSPGVRASISPSTSVSLVVSNCTSCCAQLLAQLGRVDEVAVVRQQERTDRGVLEQHRLRVGEPGAAGGAVARVADGDVAVEVVERLLVEDLGHQPHLLDHVHLVAVADPDARRLLAAVLERVQPEVREVGDVLARVVDPEEAALLLHPLVAQRDWARGAPGRGHPRGAHGTAPASCAPTRCQASALSYACSRVAQRDLEGSVDADRFTACRAQALQRDLMPSSQLLQGDGGLLRVADEETGLALSEEYTGHLRIGR